MRISFILTGRNCRRRSWRVSSGVAAFQECGILSGAAPNLRQALHCLLRRIAYGRKIDGVRPSQAFRLVEHRICDRRSDQGRWQAATFSPGGSPLPLHATELREFERFFGRTLVAITFIAPRRCRPRPRTDSTSDLRICRRASSRSAQTSSRSRRKLVRHYARKKPPSAPQRFFG